jgi:arabinose 5-phosphate isomerase
MSNFLLEAGRQTLMLELQEASRLPERLGDDFIRAAETIIHCEGKLIVSGIGKSGHIGKKLAATFASTGTPAFFVHPAEALHGDLGMLDSRDVMLFISYSGSAKELDLIVPRLEKKDSAAGDDRQIHLAAGAGGESGAGYRRGARSLSDASGADLQHRQHPDAGRRAGDGGDAGARFQ